MNNKDKLIFDEQRIVFVENFDKLCKSVNLKDLQYFKTDLLLRLESISQILLTRVINSSLGLEKNN